MYIRTPTGFSEHEGRRAGPHDSGLGQPAPAVPACLPRPRWLPKLKHYCSPKKLKSQPGSTKLIWETSAHSVELEPKLLNPGFFFTSTYGLARDTALDTKLKSLMAALMAKRAPFNTPTFTTFVNNGGRIKVALVDLSTDDKRAVPGIAEFNATHRVLGGSLAKVSLLYAAYQHRFDMNVEGSANPGAFSVQRKEALKKIYNITQERTSPALSFSFNNDFRLALGDICKNCHASRISRTLGLGYVNSALWQAGLYDCRWGGIWLGAHFNEFDPRSAKWECDKDPFNYKGNCTAEGCHGDPKGGPNITVTALALATFFTLLAQDRLVDTYSSTMIRTVLANQPALCGSRFKEGLANSGRFRATDRIYSKIGVTGTTSHEGALIDRVSIGKKYVAVVLTQSRPGNGRLGSGVRQALIEHLDKLIATNP